MKKLFTLIAIAMMAVGAQAQTISFTEVVTKGNMDGKTFGSDGFVLTCTDTSTNSDGDPDPKQEIDANSQYFGTASNYTNYTHRLKTGGKSSSKNALSLTIPSAGTLKVAVRSASSSASDRNMILKQGETEIFNQVIKENAATDYETTEIEGESKKVFPIVSVGVEAGTVDITYPKGALNFYAFIFEGTSTGIESVTAVENENAPMYNVAGQLVDDNYKGVVVKNGKKFIKK